MRVSREHDENLTSVIGSDRNVGMTAERLLTGGSIILVGAFGSGRSYFAAAVAAELRAHGTAPLMVRGSRALHSLPLGALEAADDALVGLLRAGTAPSKAPIVIVDDAHALDDASIGLLCEAIIRGRAVALVAVEADLITGTDVATPSPLIDLWLEGHVYRNDLHRLDAATADALVFEFVGTGMLDSVTRRSLFVRSHGSRRLLRELTFDAAAEVVAGRDPLDPARELTTGSRVFDVLVTSLAELDDEHRRGLALLGRLRGISYATACRFVDPAVIDDLALRGSVHISEAPDRAIWADPHLSTAAAHRLAPGRLDVALDVVVSRALASPDKPTGAALDRIIAANWHSARPSVPPPDSIEPEVRRRILVSAAHTANAAGRSDLALAYTLLARGFSDHPGLNVEASRAYAGLRRFAEAFAELTELEPTGIDSGDLRRLVRWWGTLSTWLPSDGRSEVLTRWLERGGVTDQSILCELDVQAAEAASLAMDWKSAAAYADRALATEGVHTLARVRAAILSAFTDTQLGHFDTGLSKLAAADRANRDPVSGRPASVIAELSILCFEAAAGVIARRSMPNHRQRLQAATLLAAERDDRTALALAGVAAGIILGLVNDDEELADLEFEAALRRFDRIELAAWRPLIAYLRVTFLARRGQTDAARATISEVDDQLMSQHRLYRYSRFTAEAELSASAGDLTEARRAVRAAIDERATPAGATPIYDDDLERLTRFTSGRQAAGSSPAATGPSGSAADWSPGGVTVADLSGTGSLLPADTVLTERELEVARLVAKQLSNKEIANQLYLSVRTVESHIYTARGKLGARTRRELGRIVGASPV